MGSGGMEEEGEGGPSPEMFEFFIGVTGHTSVLSVVRGGGGGEAKLGVGPPQGVHQVHPGTPWYTLVMWDI